MNYSDKERQYFMRCVFVIIAIFLLSILFGYSLALEDLQQSKIAVRRVLSEFSTINSLNIYLIFLFIFLNNAIKGFLIMLFGIFFGIAPIIFIFINGELIGLVLGASTGSAGPGKILLGLLPHGIFEIPAIIMSASYGLWLGYKLYRFIRFSEPFKVYFSLALKTFLAIVIPLFLFAAFIETFITPHVVSRLLR